MRIEIDQSGKIEDTNRLTVVAYSNHKSRSILITAEDKKNIQKFFRKTGQPKIFNYKLFATLIFVLIKNQTKSIDQIIIDREYPGYDKMILDFIYELAIKNSIKLEKEIIHFKSIGKKSRAHDISIDGYRNKKTDIKLTIRDFYKIVSK